jgi:hypothetical protein
MIRLFQSGHIKLSQVNFSPVGLPIRLVRQLSRFVVKFHLNLATLRYDKASITYASVGMRRPTMDDNENVSSATMRFDSISQVDVPKGRDGKHKKIITQLLGDIAQLNAGSALKIPLAELPDTKENIRAALSRAASQKKLSIATSSNSDFLFVWKTNEPIS